MNTEWPRPGIVIKVLAQCSTCQAVSAGVIMSDHLVKKHRRRNVKIRKYVTHDFHTCPGRRIFFDCLRHVCHTQIPHIPRAEDLFFGQNMTHVVRSGFFLVRGEFSGRHQGTGSVRIFLVAGRHQGQGLDNFRQRKNGCVENQGHTRQDGGFFFR